MSTETNFASPKDWVRYCRIMLEWLNPKQQNLDPEKWVEEVVIRAQSLNVDTLLFQKLSRDLRNTPAFH